MTLTKSPFSSIFFTQYRSFFMISSSFAQIFKPQAVRGIGTHSWSTWKSMEKMTNPLDSYLIPKGSLFPTQSSLDDRIEQLLTNLKTNSAEWTLKIQPETLNSQRKIEFRNPHSRTLNALKMRIKTPEIQQDAIEFHFDLNKRPGLVPKLARFMEETSAFAKFTIERKS